MIDRSTRWTSSSMMHQSIYWFTMDDLYPRIFLYFIGLVGWKKIFFFKIIDHKLYCGGILYCRLRWKKIERRVEISSNRSVQCFICTVFMLPDCNDIVLIRILFYFFFHFIRCRRIKYKTECVYEWSWFVWFVFLFLFTGFGNVRKPESVGGGEKKEDWRIRQYEGFINGLIKCRPRFRIRKYHIWMPVNLIRWHFRRFFVLIHQSFDFLWFSWLYTYQHW